MIVFFYGSAQRDLFRNFFCQLSIHGFGKRYKTTLAHHSSFTHTVKVQLPVFQVEDPSVRVVMSNQDLRTNFIVMHSHNK